MQLDEDQLREEAVRYERNQEVWVSMEALGLKGIQRGRYKGTINKDSPTKICHKVQVSPVGSPNAYRPWYVHGTYNEAANRAEEMREHRIERLNLDIDRLHKLNFREA